MNNEPELELVLVEEEKDLLERLNSKAELILKKLRQLQHKQNRRTKVN